MKEQAELIEKNINQAKERENQFLTWMTIFLAFISIVGSIFGLMGIKNFRDYKNELHLKFKEQIEIEFLKIKRINLATIKRMLNNEEWVFNLSDNSNIMVFNPIKTGDDSFFGKVLEEFNSIELLPNIKLSQNSLLVDEIKTKKQVSKLNVLLLENSDAEYDLDDSNNREMVIDLIKKIPNDVFIIYYGPRGMQGFPSSKADFGDDNFAKEIVNRISFVNAPSKLYFNILETLKFMDISKT